MQSEIFTAGRDEYFHFWFVGNEILVTKRTHEFDGDKTNWVQIGVTGKYFFTGTNNDDITLHKVNK